MIASGKKMQLNITVLAVKETYLYKYEAWYDGVTTVCIIWSHFASIQFKIHNWQSKREESEKKKIN